MCHFDFHTYNVFIFIIFIFHPLIFLLADEVFKDALSDFFQCCGICFGHKN